MKSLTTVSQISLQHWGDTKQNREQINRKRSASSWFAGHKWFPQALKRIFNQTQHRYTANSTNVRLSHEVLNAKAFNIWIYWPQTKVLM